MVLISAVVWAGSFSFEAIPPDGNLWKETISDPYGFTSKVTLQQALGQDSRPTQIRSSVLVFDGASQVDTVYVDLPYRKQNLNDTEGKYSHFTDLRAGMSVSALRFNWKNIEAELTVNGALNTLFNIFDNSECLGFDGTYLLGMNLRISEKATVRFGMHHFSGHYGDEMMDDFFDFNKIDASSSSVRGDGNKINNTQYIPNYNPAYDYYLKTMMEYVRDNAWIAGVQVYPVNGLSIFASWNFPRKRFG